MPPPAPSPARAALRAGRAARRADVAGGRSRGLPHELRGLLAARSAPARADATGRLLEWARPGPTPAGDPAPFLSGDRGEVRGARATVRAAGQDLLLDLAAAPRDRALARAAAAGPRRRVLVLGIERAGGLMGAARAELARSHHEVLVRTRPAGTAGKWENVGLLLAETPAAGHDWLLVVDDDVGLPRGFLDTFLFLAERFSFRLAQPAHRRRSHAAWAMTRRRAGAVARRTRFVEIGPVVAFRADTFGAVLPFPPLRTGWGLDAHWAAVAERERWPVGVVDATPVSHVARPVAAAYPAAAAHAEARAFLAERPWVPLRDQPATLGVFTHW